jgi:hypothetical protein
MPQRIVTIHASPAEATWQFTALPGHWPMDLAPGTWSMTLIPER